MSGITQQLPALVGVVIGALASYLAGAAAERTRWRRDQSSRWDDRRAQAYADYGYAVKNVYVQCLRAASLHAQGTAAGPEAAAGRAAYAESLTELGKLTDERTAAWEPVLLLGDPATIAAGRLWHRRVWQMELFARGERTGTAQWESVLGEVNTDRARFYTAARRDLGITSGNIPLGGPWDAEDAPAPAQPDAT